jgi:hypothetical protein
MCQPCRQRRKPGLRHPTSPLHHRFHDLSLPGSSEPIYTQFNQPDTYTRFNNPTLADTKISTFPWRLPSARRSRPPPRTQLLYRQ